MCVWWPVPIESLIEKWIEHRNHESVGYRRVSLADAAGPSKSTGSARHALSGAGYMQPSRAGPMT
jgi:hypothetical protein